MSSPQWLRRFRFLGKMAGMAVRHGLQMGLDLPRLYWRRLCGLPCSTKHLEEVDQVFVNTMRYIAKLVEEEEEEVKQQQQQEQSETDGSSDSPAATEAAAARASGGSGADEDGAEEREKRSAEEMAEALGVDRFLEVPMSNGSVVPTEPGGGDTPLSYYNAQRFVKKDLTVI